MKKFKVKLEAISRREIIIDAKDKEEAIETIEEIYMKTPYFNFSEDNVRGIIVNAEEYFYEKEKENEKKIEEDLKKFYEKFGENIEDNSIECLKIKCPKCETEINVDETIEGFID